MQVHPDANSQEKYVVGTKLQMRKKGTSHKKNSCQYHDVSLTRQGEKISTMNQVVNKINISTIQQLYTTLGGFASCQKKQDDPGRQAEIL